MDSNRSQLTYPLQLEGTLEPQLSRGLWLIKWLLVLPHMVVLAFLWLAFAALSLVALVARVVTGRYPRGIFDFHVGVLRWTWRVPFYSYRALVTDRYPPFTLADKPDYPARVEAVYPARVEAGYPARVEAVYPARVEAVYPESLSRALALVTWWLLALQHYLDRWVFAGVANRAISGTSKSAERPCGQ